MALHSMNLFIFIELKKVLGEYIFPECDSAQCWKKTRRAEHKLTSKCSNKTAGLYF